MNFPKKIYIAYYNEGANRLWKLTDSEKEASRLDSNYQLATLADLNDWSCVGGLFADDIVEVEDGLFVWVAFRYINRLGSEENFCEYMQLEPIY